MTTSIPRLSTRLAILSLLFCSIIPSVHAQAGWIPDSVDMGPNLKGPARAAAVARLQAIKQLLKQVPELAHPDGFEIVASLTGHGRRTGLNNSEHADYAVEYRYTVSFFSPKFVKGVLPTGVIVFMVNGEENMHGDLDAQGRTIFAEETRWPRTPFSIATYGVSASGNLQAGEDFTISTWFTAGNEFPWRPVSREDYYNYIIAGAEGISGERRAVYKKATEKSAYQRWLDEAPKRKAEREQVIKVVAQANAGEARNLRKTLEDSEREAGENLKKDEKNEREEAKTAFATTDAMRAELNRMTPAQRKLPAILETDVSRTEWRATGATMLDRDTVTATVHRALTPNYDFWRARRPDEVRTINVHLEGSDTPAIQNAVYQMYKKFDWRALAALANQPTRP